MATAAKKEVEKVEKPKEHEKVSDFMGFRLQVAEAVRAIYHATVEPNVTREHLLDPKFWQHVAPNFRQGTRIEVVTDDMKYYCELMVIAAGKNWAKVKELRYADLTIIDKFIENQIKMDQFRVEWKGPALKNCIVRVEDSEIIKDQIQDYDSAVKYMKEYVKTISK